MNSTETVKNIINNRISQSILVGALITTIFIFVLKLPIEKFRFELVSTELKSESDNILWFSADFDNDGNSERLRCDISNSSNRFSIIAYNHLDKYIFDFNLKDDFWSPNLKPSILDINNDSIKEFVFFTLRKDSIFLNAIDIINDKMVIDHLFFHTIERYGENLGVNSVFNTIGDFDNDGNRELFFSFDAGYGLYPRGIFKLNLTTLEFILPEKMYSPAYNSFLTDITDDGIPEILAPTYSPANVHFKTKYNDNQSYIMVYDINLNHLFPPIAMPGINSSVYSCTAQTNDSVFYSLYIPRTDTTLKNQIMVVSKSGQIIKQQELPQTNFETERYLLYFINKVPYLIITNFGKFRLTPDFKHIPKELEYRKKTDVLFPHQLIDLDQDGWDEQISIRNSKTIEIYNERFNTTNRLDVPFSPIYQIAISPYYKNGKIDKFFFTNNANYSYFKYYKNPYFFTIYLIYLGIFLFFSGLIFVLLFFQQKRIEKNWQMEKQLSELQFNSVKNQLNPHFMFNALNSVAYLINNGQKDEAYDFLTVNSRMIQRVMNDAKEIKRTLKEELDFSKDYLHIQQHRFKERFKSEFIIEPDVDMAIEVPKMCIHTYVENAVKHGFRNIRMDGLLQIKISSVINGVCISITDNGMGRKAASEYKDSSGNGLNIMDEFYNLFEKYHHYKIKCNIVDLKKEIDMQTGMRVELKIQTKLR